MYYDYIIHLGPSYKILFYEPLCSHNEGSFITKKINEMDLPCVQHFDMSTTFISLEINVPY